MRASPVRAETARHPARWLIYFAFSAGLSALTPSSAFSQEETAPAAPRLTLADCIGIAMQNQPGIRVQQAGVGIANEVQNTARSYFLPQVGVAAGLVQLNQHIFTLSPSPFTGPLGDTIADTAAFFNIARQAGASAALQALNQPNAPPFSTIRQTTLNALSTPFQSDLLGDRFLVASVLLRQPIYTGGRILYRNQQADLGVQAATAGVGKARQETVFQVSRAYWSILLTRALVRMTDETIGQFRAVEELARSSIQERVREVTMADVDRAGSLRLLAESQRVEFQRQEELALAGLRTAMGVDPQLPLEIADERLDYRPLRLDLPTLIAQALSRRPEITGARLNLRNAELEKKLAAAQFCPEVGLFASFITIHDDANFMNPTNPNIFAGGIQASMPLYAGGRRLAECRKADWRCTQARELLRSLEQLIDLEVRQAYLEYQQMADRIPTDANSVRDARAALAVYENLWAARAIERKDYPKHFENLSTGRLLLSQAEASYNQHVYAYNLALEKLRLATACYELPSSPERVPPAAGALPAPRSDGRPEGRGE